MPYVIQPIPEPADVPELCELLNHKNDEEFVAQLEMSLTLCVSAYTCINFSNQSANLQVISLGSNPA